MTLHGQLLNVFLFYVYLVSLVLFLIALMDIRYTLYKNSCESLNLSCSFSAKGVAWDTYDGAQDLVNNIFKSTVH